MMNLTRNMGMNDRIIRGLIGALLLWHGSRSEKPSKLNQVEKVVGGAFVVYGVTGIDPLLAALGVTTIPGDKHNVVNQMKKLPLDRVPFMPAKKQSMPERWLYKAKSLPVEAGKRLARR